MNFTTHPSREEDLIDACRRGDRQAQRWLFDRYSSRMHGLSLRYVKHPMQAEDVVVMAFTKVFRKIDQFKGEGSFEGWIRRIVVNEALGALRKSRAMMIETDLEKAEREPDYNRLEDHLQVEDLLKIISELPPGYRVIFNMYAIDGYSHREIAEQLGITENTSKSQLSRARAYLQRVLAETGWHTQKSGTNEPATR